MKLGPISQEDFKAIQACDVRSGRTIKLDSTAAGDKTNVVAYGILVIQPALLIHRPGIGYRVLQKSIVLAISRDSGEPTASLTTTELEKTKNAEAQKEAERKGSEGDKHMDVLEGCSGAEDVFEKLRIEDEEEVRSRWTV